MKRESDKPVAVQPPAGTRWIALAVATSYGFLGALWIGFSDQFVAQLDLDEAQFTRVQQYKGWVYVLLTSVLLYLLLRYMLRHLDRSINALNRSRNQLDSINRLYRMLRTVKSSLLREDTLEPLLEEACRVAVAEGEYRMAWVVMFDPDRRHLRAVAHNGPGQALIRNRVVDPDQMPAESPISRTLETGKPTFVNGCRRDSFLDGRGGRESELGYASVAAIPLFRDSRVIGSFAVYADQTAAFDRDEARLLLEIGESLNFAIDKFSKTAGGNSDGGNNHGYGAEHDEITGLPTRRTFERQVAQALARANRRSEHVALIVLDVDGFRHVNDVLGRAAGDQVLKTVATMLTGSLRPGDCVGRLGSDEFAVLLVDLPGDQAIGASIAHIGKGFPQRLPINDHEVNVSVSMGVGLFPDDAKDAEELFACAELALHNAPSDARGQITYYEPELNERARRQRELELALHDVQVERDFHLAWQPIVDVRSSQLFGAEALLRWSHPRLGNIPPDVFIPLAEMSGQIIELGRWVLEQAILQGDAWAAQGLVLDVHVNVSLLQLQHATFVDELADQLKKHKTSPDWTLVVEITESQIMADPEATASSCRRIKALGCKIDLDDFGTGYSALNYLTRLPLDALKLDRSFVVRASEDANMLAVVEEVVRMAKRLGLTVVAEGVETRAHLKLLGELGCNHAQGYLFGCPDTAEKLTAQWTPARWARARSGRR
ncbi:MAG: GGDEF domain-containing protein [Wenzhouxiangellaceae bacterium]|nr:GGDEF domain-containing protein [Wenzhouxiangellaceae bacterium]